jgi:hypothetical protein
MRFVHDQSYFLHSLMSHIIVGDTRQILNMTHSISTYKVELINLEPNKEARKALAQLWLHCQIKSWSRLFKHQLVPSHNLDLSRKTKLYFELMVKGAIRHTAGKFIMSLFRVLNTRLRLVASVLQVYVLGVSLR